MMEFFNTLNAWVANGADWIFGWILYLPRDLQLFAVALFTSAALNIARKLRTKDQEWLHRSVADVSRQNALIKEAKKRGDKESVNRHKDTINLIKMKTMRFEGKPLLWALLPVGLIATWAFMRVAYLPPRLNEPVTVNAYVARTDIGKTAHLVPEPGIEAVDGWVQPVVEDKVLPMTGIWDQIGVWIGDHLRGILHGKLAGVPAPPPNLEGVVTWHVIAHDANPHTLKVRYAGHTFEISFVAGRHQYEDPVKTFKDASVQTLEVMLKPMRLFDFVGDLWFLPAWMTAYLMICIAFFYIFRGVLNIA
ncbi:MAG: hypothetical protein WCS70_00210 [Verrucomicrobiota bacterium]